MSDEPVSDEPNGAAATSAGEPNGVLTGRLEGDVTTRVEAPDGAASPEETGTGTRPATNGGSETPSADETSAGAGPALGTNGGETPPAKAAEAEGEAVDERPGPGAAGDGAPGPTSDDDPAGDDAPTVELAAIGVPEPDVASPGPPAESAGGAAGQADEDTVASAGTASDELDGKGGGPTAGLPSGEGNGERPEGVAESAGEAEPAGLAEDAQRSEAVADLAEPGEAASVEARAGEADAGSGAAAESGEVVSGEALAGEVVAGSDAVAGSGEVVPGEVLAGEVVAGSGAAAGSGEAESAEVRADGGRSEGVAGVSVGEAERAEVLAGGGDRDGDEARSDGATDLIDTAEIDVVEAPVIEAEPGAVTGAEAVDAPAVEAGSDRADTAEAVVVEAPATGGEVVEAPTAETPVVEAEFGAVKGAEVVEAPAVEAEAVVAETPVVEAQPGEADETEAAGALTVEMPVVEAEPGGALAGEEEKAGRRLAWVAVPVLLVALVVGAWAVDTVMSSGEVVRNVEVAGRPVGGASEAALGETVSGMAAEVAERTVTIEVGGKTYEGTAATLGLTLDEKATTEAALDAGRDGFIGLRPVGWVGSLFSPREVAPRYAVSTEQATAALELIQGPDRTAAVEPTIRLEGEGFVAVPGVAGTGVDPVAVARALPEAAAGSLDGPIAVTLDSNTVPPRFTDDQARALADRANTMTAGGLRIVVDGATVDVPVEQLRTWIGPTVTDDGRFDLALNGDAANPALAELFAPLQVAPVDATVTLVGGQPTVSPSQDGVTCCGDDAGTTIWDALTNGRTEVELDTAVAPPARTTEEVQGWGITQPVGGSRGWRSGAEVPGPAPGFTTYHACCESRVTNIHRMADLVRGAVIPPGGTFSINDYVGQRTAEKGFVEAGAIANGEHVQEIGGGVSQFATTTFNAAFFAGLDITSYQAHSEYFSRYPRGREATMGYPSPDLALRNDTPYGMMIWTSYTDTSLTVTFYSTPWVTAEQTSIGESSYGACRNVSTTRTRTYPDGTTKQDTFRATYRPGPGQFC